MTDKDIIALISGVLTAIFMVILVTIFCHAPYMTHNVGWSQTACVISTDVPATTSTNPTEAKTSKHCVSGEELATWAKEKGR